MLRGRPLGRPPRGRGAAAAVAEVRGEIAAAAVACDYDRLQAARARAGRLHVQLRRRDSAADYWAGEEERGQDVMKILVETLRQTGHLYQGNWVWPTAYSDTPTDADWSALVGLYPADQLTSWRSRVSSSATGSGLRPAATGSSSSPATSAG